MIDIIYAQLATDQRQQLLTTAREHRQARQALRRLAPGWPARSPARPAVPAPALTPAR